MLLQTKSLPDETFYSVPNDCRAYFSAHRDPESRRPLLSAPGNDDQVASSSTLATTLYRKKLPPFSQPEGLTQAQAPITGHSDAKTLLLVGCRAQILAPFLATTPKHRSTTTRAVPCAKTVGIPTLYPMRLVCPFHRESPLPPRGYLARAALQTISIPSLSRRRARSDSEDLQNEKRALNSGC